MNSPKKKERKLEFILKNVAEIIFNYFYCSIIFIFVILSVLIVSIKLILINLRSNLIYIDKYV
jgi:hypothetical protein